MGILCAFGLHPWTGCKCEGCGRTRDAEHRWNGCECASCYKVRDVEHRWRGCKCEVCTRTRDAEHPWRGCKCPECGKVRNQDHDWADERCGRCGARPTPEQWAARLEGSKDYRVLASYLLRDSALERNSELRSSKRYYARKSLERAGVDAVPAILEELEKDDSNFPDHELAGILVDIGDPSAVPLLKRLGDRGAWDPYYPRKITEFVESYPQFHGGVEQVTCAVCGRVRPVAETARVDDKRFCRDSCWSKRGRVIEHGIGTGCPQYVDGLCVVAGEDTGPCSLQEGTYQNCSWRLKLLVSRTPL